MDDGCAAYRDLFKNNKNTKSNHFKMWILMLIWNVQMAEKQHSAITESKHNFQSRKEYTPVFQAFKRSFFRWCLDTAQ